MATTNKNLALPANGSFVNGWDVPLNSNFTVIDTALGGITNLNVTSVSGNASLSGNQSIPPNIVIAGNLSGNVAYQFPANTGGFWSVTNNSVGVGNITFGVSGGGNVTTVLQGYAATIKSDGTNVNPFDNAPNNAGGNVTQIQYNSGGGVLAGSSKLTWSGSTLGLTGVLQLNGNSTGYIGFQAPATATPTIWTLPAADGTSGQVLTTNGNTSLSWTTVSGGGGAVTSFNTRTGPITLVSSDVTSALGFTPVASSGNITGSAATLTTPRTISITGDLAYTSPGFDGSANVTAAGTLATVNGNVGTFGNATSVAQITVNAKGLITGASNVAISVNASIPYAMFTDQQTSGTGSGESISGVTWTKRTLNTTINNTIPGASLSSNQVTGLPAGTYRVSASAVTTGNNSTPETAILRIRNVTASTTLAVSSVSSVTAATGLSQTATLDAVFVLAGTTTIELDSYTGSASTGGSGIGSGEAEIYAVLVLEKIA